MFFVYKLEKERVQFMSDVLIHQLKYVKSFLLSRLLSLIH